MVYCFIFIYLFICLFIADTKSSIIWTHTLCRTQSVCVHIMLDFRRVLFRSLFRLQPFRVPFRFCACAGTACSTVLRKLCKGMCVLVRRLEICRNRLIRVWRTGFSRWWSADNISLEWSDYVANHRVVHGTCLSAPFPSHSNLCLFPSHGIPITLF